MTSLERLGNDVVPEVITPDEVLPAGVTVRGYEALPDGFVPSQPIPVGFVLRSVLTSGELMDPDTERRFTKEGRRLRYKHGAEAVFTTCNELSLLERNMDPDSISLAEFIKHGAKPLPILTRAKRATSRAIFGLKCDVNF